MLASGGESSQSRTCFLKGITACGLVKTWHSISVKTSLAFLFPEELRDWRTCVRLTHPCYHKALIHTYPWVANIKACPHLMYFYTLSAALGFHSCWENTVCPSCFWRSWKTDRPVWDWLIHVYKPNCWNSSEKASPAVKRGEKMITIINPLCTILASDIIGWRLDLNTFS